MKLLDGKAVSNRLMDEMTEEVAALAVKPCLAVILVGDDPASRVYVNNKKKGCERLGIRSLEYTLPENATERELLELVDALNSDAGVNGILVQLPLPKHMNEKTVIRAIRPEKDVDAFHPVNVGKIMIGDFDFLPCTPAGIMELIKESGTDLTGKECVVIGRSNIVGKPMAMLLLHQNATITVCHSKTRDLKEVTRRADVVVAAVGIPNFVTADMVRPGAVVIDVGINRLENGKLTGDVDFDAVAPIASAITPVPGGVGPMTIAMLMRNTITAAKKQNQK